MCDEMDEWQRDVCHRKVWQRAVDRPRALVGAD